MVTWGWQDMQCEGAVWGQGTWKHGCLGLSGMGMGGLGMGTW